MPALLCPTCNTSVPSYSRYCLSCGSQVSEPSQGGILGLAPEPHPLLDRMRAELAPEYDVLRELGRGGMAVVFLAMETDLRRSVAIKVLPPEMGLTPQVAERFKREARMAASLDHQNILPVYRVGQVAGMHYIVTKYIEGRSLEAIIGAQGALPISVTLMILRSVTSALAFAHSRGIIHRDIKGANILIDTDGRIIVADFGIARAADDSTITATGSVVGTPAFMSPEQCSGQPVGPQGDQYSLGVVAFQMLTGSVPFTAPTLPGVMQHHFFTPPPDIANIREGVPGELNQLISRLLAKKPEERFASTDDMLAAVEALPFSDAVRKRAEAALRELARGVSLQRISTTGPGQGEPTVIRDVAATVRTPGTRELLEASVANFASPPSDAEMPVPATRPIATVVPANPSLDPIPAHPVSATSVQSRRSKRVRLPWIGAAAIAILLVLATMIMIGRFGGGRGGSGSTAQQNAEAQPFVDRAIRAKERGDVPTARRELTSALELSPDHPTALREMGTLMYGVGNFDLARNFLVRAVRADPNDRGSQQALGCALVKLNRTEEGRRFLDRTGGDPRSCR